jgi:hypothetical protein
VIAAPNTPLTPGRCETHDPQRAIIFHLRSLELGAPVVADVPQDDAPHCAAGPRIGVQDRPGLRRDGGHGLVELVAGFRIHAQPPHSHWPA